MSDTYASLVKMQKNQNTMLGIA